MAAAVDRLEAEDDLEGDGLRFFDPFGRPRFRFGGELTEGLAAAAVEEAEVLLPVLLLVSPFATRSADLSSFRGERELELQSELESIIPEPEPLAVADIAVIGNTQRRGAQALLHPAAIEKRGENELDTGLLLSRETAVVVRVAQPGLDE